MADVENRPDEQFSLAILICTHRRPDSLRRTLDSLSAADRSGIDLEVLVVENAAPGEPAYPASSYGVDLPVRWFREERIGKGHALNRALRECGGAEIIAVLDDDITVEPDWFAGVRSLTRRWPDKGFFTGSLRVAWPDADVPAWVHEPALTSWAFSALASQRDRPIGAGRWASGNHFWFRSRLLPPGYRFNESWLCEPPLMLDFAERGYGGVIGPDAAATHHISRDLLREEVLRDRALQVGRGFANVRIKPFRASVRQAVLFHRHPLVARMFCGLNVVRWRTSLFLGRFIRSPVPRFLHELRAMERLAAYQQFLVTCRECPEYRVWRRGSCQVAAATDR